MESPLLFGCVSVDVPTLGASELERLLAPSACAASESCCASAANGSLACDDDKLTRSLAMVDDSGVCAHGAAAASDLLCVHARHRRRLYAHYARCLAHVSDTHAHYEFMLWCHTRRLFVHPALRVTRIASAYRDHAFYVAADVPALTPLLAIPESLLIGFGDVADEDAQSTRNALYDAERERQFHALNSRGANDSGDGGRRTTGVSVATSASAPSSATASGDTDVCAFFFASLSMLVADLVTARNSPLSDVRHDFARALTRVRTLHNAPYLGVDVVFVAREPCLADVLLQMVRYYVNGGPLVNKVTRDELRWAVSVCLSHATPLVLGAVRSIGLVPFVHLFPHGGAATNAFVVARNAHVDAAARIAARLRAISGYDFSSLNDGKCVYVVPSRPLRAGEAVLLQAMAPVCDRDDDVAAAQMWQLSCGSAPADYMRSADVAAQQAELTQRLLQR